MAIKFWKSETDENLFVRFDAPSPEGGGPSFVWLCYSSGRPHSSGHIINFRGDRAGGIRHEVAAAAGLKLDGEKRITADSLAEICAEMARQIQSRNDD